MMTLNDSFPKPFLLNTSLPASHLSLWGVWVCMFVHAYL